MSQPFSSIAVRALFLYGGVLLIKLDSSTAKIHGARATRQLKPYQHVRLA